MTSPPIPGRLSAWIRRQIAGREMRLLIQRASAVFLIQVAGAGLMFVTGILLGRWLGATAYGQYSFAITLVMVLRTAAAMGMPNLMVRCGAVYQANRDWGHLKGLLRYATVTNLLWGAIVAAALGLGVLLFTSRPFAATHLLILLSLPLLLLTPLSETASNTVRGLQRVSLGQACDLSRSGFNLLVLLIAVAFGITISGASAMVLRCTGEALGLAATLFMLNRLLPRELKAAGADADRPLWRKGQISFGAIAAMQLIYQTTDVLLLGFMRPMAELGVYRMAANLCSLLLFASIIASATLAPLAASAWAEGRKAELHDASMRMSRLAFLLTLTLYIALIAATPILIRILGPDFKGLTLPLAILGAGQVVRALMSSASSVAQMTGSEREAALAITIAAAINLALNASLIPLFGMIGAACATATSTVLLGTFYAMVALRHTGISGSAFALKLRARQAAK